MVGVLLGLFFQQDRQVQFDFDQIADNLPEDTPLLISVGFDPSGHCRCTAADPNSGCRLGTCFAFTGIDWNESEKTFILSCGLLTKVSATVPRRRIQFISIHRTPLLRLMKMASIRIETAGGAGKENEDAAATVTRRWFVPIIPEALVPALISQLRVGFEFDEATVPWQSVSPRAGRRLIKLCIVGVILVTMVGLLITRPWGWLLGVACLPLLVLWSRRHLKMLAYARVDDGFVFRSGVWTLKTSVTFFDRIQTLELQRVVV